MCLAIPGKILSIERELPPFRDGKVDFGGITKSINLSYVPDAKVGEYVLVHVGFAISVVDEDEAVKIFEYLETLGETAELML